MKSQILSIVLIISLLVSSSVFAQLKNPVKWNYSVTKISDTEAELVFNATIEAKWHLYSQFFPEGGPIPLAFTYPQSANYEIVGKTSESPKPKEEFDDIFKITVKFFSGKATFKQKIKIASKNSFEIKVPIAGQACLDDGMCVPIDEEAIFKIDITKSSSENVKSETNTQAISNQSNTKSDTAKTTTPVVEPQKDSLQKATNSATIGETNSATEPSASEMSLWAFFLAALVGGFFALLTPCIYPMIPMTVSFFMKNSENRAKAISQAMVYGLSIVGIYVMIGVLFAITKTGPGFANWLSTHWVPNVFFFLIFIFFAASFLGMFELVLPSWLVNKVDSQADRGGFTGAFFMAFTLVLVSFSCTAPIASSVLIMSSQGEFIKPIVGMLGFSLAFAVPFTLFAIFPSWMQSLPKSGGWLNSVKVILGFIELALALKFLSVADLTYHWGILDREIYLGFWIVIAFLAGMYLLGKLKFAHDSDVPYISVPRLLLSICSFAVAVYLIPGLFGAPLKALSGWIPPQSTMDFDLKKMISENPSSSIELPLSAPDSMCSSPKYADRLEIPHGLKGYFDYEQGMACAKSQNKPVFLDFTGHGCTNCRKMEEYVWDAPSVLPILRKEFIIISLYVDDKTIELPENEIYKNAKGKKITLLGEKNTDLQITKFDANAQPYYIILDSDGNKLINNPIGFSSIEDFKNYLLKGLKEFKKRK